MYASHADVAAQVEALTNSARELKEALDVERKQRSEEQEAYSSQVSCLYCCLYYCLYYCL
jgi:hypothetical protein